MQSNFYVRPSVGEQIQTSVTLHTDPRPALLGTAVGEDGRPIADALVILTASGLTEPDRLVGTTYTDALGQFAFGPLTSGTLYQVRICQTNLHLRTLEQAKSDESME